MTGSADLRVETLGEPRHASPLAGYVSGRVTNEHYVDEDDRVLYDDTVDRLYRRGLDRDSVPSLEPGGPRRRLFFPPGATRVGIVTCGGLCPGLNDVIRGLVVMGGDGSMRGAARIAGALRERAAPVAVIGIPKTIDNDIPYIGQSFGFQTAFTVAARSINAAMVEARAAIGGVGLVKLMGRHSGFIACYAALANHDADFVLIPEVPFTLTGKDGLLAALAERVADAGSAVVVAAEGAGQELLTGTGATDPSGNTGLADIGGFLRNAITDDFAARGQPLTLKYVDPGYAIRSVRAEAPDSVYCVRLAQAAVHAGMAGRTDVVVGRRHNRFVHVPIALVVSERNQVAPDGDLWLSVLESTGQPLRMGVD